MVGSLAGAGLGLTLREALAPLTDRGFVVRSLVASWAVCPAVAMLLLAVIPLERPYATGLLLLSLAPCAPFAPAMVQRVRGDDGYLAAFMLLSAVMTVAMMPLAVPRLIGGPPVDALAIARPLLAFVCVPLLAVMCARSLAPLAAERARPLLAGVANASGGVTLLLIVVMYGRAVLDAVGSFAIATQVVFVGGVTAVAHLLGANLPDERRRVLTIGICTRNLGAALAPLGAVESDPRAVVMIVMAVPVMLVMSALVTRWLVRGGRRMGPLSHAA